METLFWCSCTLLIGVIAGILLDLDFKYYEKVVKNLKMIEIKKARRALMKVRDRQCVEVKSKCSICPYNTEDGCLANGALKDIINIEMISTPDDDEETLDEDEYTEEYEEEVEVEE